MGPTCPIATGLDKQRSALGLIHRPGKTREKAVRIPAREVAFEGIVEGYVGMVRRLVPQQRALAGLARPGEHGRRKV